MKVELSQEECKALYDLIDGLSGGNPENVFAWDGTDSLDDPTTSAAAKVFTGAGRSIPESLETGDS